jgi:hypothetical protein
MGALAVKLGVVTSAAALAALGAIVAPATASAFNEDGSMNGTYIATSNGEWAQTNERFQDEASKRNTWTISTACINPTDCVGTVKSDEGWSAPIYKRSGIWYVKRALPNWEPCPDGTFVDGMQMYRFFAGDPLTGEAKPLGSDTYLGEDNTTTVSGSCGINKQLEIRIPFKLVAA